MTKRPELWSASLQYARVQPLLCRSTPHRFFPITKALTLCVRCGTVAPLRSAPVAVRVVLVRR